MHIYPAFNSSIRFKTEHTKDKLKFATNVPHPLHFTEERNF